MPIYNARLSSIDPVETRRYAGLAKAPDFEPDLLNKACEEILLLAEPRACWHEYAYDDSTQIIMTEPPVILHGEHIGRHLKGCKQAIALAVTVGEAVEKAITELFSVGEYTLALLMDAAATTAVEQTADAAEKAVALSAKKVGASLRSRFSPGYGDWNLTAQREILPLADGSSIGIGLTDSLMLVPRKSVTAIIGLSTHGGAVQPQPRCGGCRQPNCASRRT